MRHTNKMKNISFEKPSLFKNLKKQVSFHTVIFCYVFPQQIDTWNDTYKKSTMYCFLWFRVIFYYRIEKRFYNEPYTTIPS
jgi:hypothetical protein